MRLFLHLGVLPAFFVGLALWTFYRAGKRAGKKGDTE